MTHLSVNVDHVATLRQARGTTYPSPVEAARLAEASGAAGITVHLRGDRRHIQDQDLNDLRQTVRGKLNLEIAAEDEMLAIAVEQRTDQVTLVPERPGEVTTEGGLDLIANRERLSASARRLADSGILVSLFVDPDRRQLESLPDWDLTSITGFEINTDHYTRARGDQRDAELDRFNAAADVGAEMGLKVYAGHGLTTANVGPIAAHPAVEELNIGHWLISRATLVGISTAVEEMLAAMRGLTL